MNKEYLWNKPETDAHKYIIPGIIKILQKFKIPKESYLLEAGCGGGHITYFLWKSGFKNVYGFDVSSSGIEVAKTSFPEIRDRFFVHDAYNEKLPECFPKKYDLILSVEVVEHLFLPELYLKNIRIWLNDKSIVIITTPYHGYFKNLLIAILNKYDSHHNPLWDFGHIKFYSKNTLYTLLKNSGFQPIYFMGLGRIPLLWKSMLIVSTKNEKIEHISNYPNL